MRITVLLLSIPIFFISHKLSAQGLCNNGGGGFSLDPAEGCAPVTTQITSTVANPVTVEYSLDYKGNANPGFISVSSYQYASAGTFTILQRAFLPSGNIVYACQKIKVFESRPVSAQYTSCGGGTINLIIADDPVSRSYDQFQIEWGDGSVQIINKGSALTVSHGYTSTSGSPTLKVTGLYNAGTACSQGKTFSQVVSFQQAQLSEIAIKSAEMRGDGTLRITYQGVTAIPTDIKFSTDGNQYTTSGTRSSGGVQPYDIKSLNVNQVYQLKLSSKDLCAGISDSKVVGSMTLSGKSQDEKNTLTWNQYSVPAEFESYDLLKDGTIIKSFTNLTDVTYTDEDVQCGSFSEYQVIVRLKDGVTSSSAPVGVKTEIAAPKPIEQAVVSVDGANLVTIKASIPGAGPNSTYDLTIEKAEAGSTTFKKIITLYNQSEHSDPEVQTGQTSYCYRMSYQNSCGQQVPASQPICTILLRKNLSTLNWTTPSPTISGVTGYDVLQTGSSGSSDVIPVQLLNTYTTKLNAQSDLEYSFRVRANSAAAGFESYSNVVDYRRSAGVFVPDAFSPNGDGHNDVLEARSEQLASFAISIMNRWGEVVFHSDDIATGWDGTVKGIAAPVGSYVYRITFTDDINQTVEKSGTFMLLR